MTSANHDFTPQRRLNRAESAALAAEVLERARQALHCGSTPATDEVIDAKVAAWPSPIAPPRHGWWFPGRARIRRRSLLQRALSFRPGPGFECAVIAALAMVTGTGAALNVTH